MKYEVYKVARYKPFWQRSVKGRRDRWRVVGEGGLGEGY